MNKCVERLYNGIIKENPTFILMLGMCPTLATTTSAINGLGMGLSTTAVLMFSNLLISALRKIIPDRVRIPAFIVVVASLVTVVQLLMQGYVPSLYASLGIYIPLIVVNCIILGRAEAYACKNGPVESFFDGLGMGLGFSLSLCAVSSSVQVRSSDTPSFRKLTTFPSSSLHRVLCSLWLCFPRSRTSSVFHARPTVTHRSLTLYAVVTVQAVQAVSA